MPIPITCSVCSASYTLKDGFTGSRVKCPGCGNVLDVPAGAPVPPAPAETSRTEPGDYPEDLPDEFRRDKFLLRQKVWSIKQKYRVSDETGEPILHVERPVYLAQGCLAVFAGMAIILGGIFGAVMLAGERGAGDVAIALGIALGVAGVVAGVIVMIALYPRRHVAFYADESKRELLLEVKQDSKLAVINFWYTLTDRDGAVLARFRKNYLHGIFRNRWYIHGPDGDILFEVKEDSIILSLLRRTIGGFAEEIPLLGLALAAALRTNFVFTRAGGLDVIGEFNRRLTIVDRYVLDLTADGGRHLDRRVAVAMGVMLDTGEGR